MIENNDWQQSHNNVCDDSFVRAFVHGFVFNFNMNSIIHRSTINKAMDCHYSYYIMVAIL